MAVAHAVGRRARRGIAHRGGTAGPGGRACEADRTQSQSDRDGSRAELDAGAPEARAEVLCRALRPQHAVRGAHAIAALIRADRRRGRPLRGQRQAQESALGGRARARRGRRRRVVA